MSILTSFKESAKEFKSVRSLVLAALLVALHTVFSFFLSIQVTPSLRISISFLINVIIGVTLGPVMGFVCGGVGDIVQFVIKSTGPFFPGWTISAALAGLIYGSFLYKKYPQAKKTVLKKFSPASQEEETETEQNADKSKSSLFKTLNLVSGLLIPFINLALMAFMPLAKVSDKKKNFEMTGSGLDFVKNGFSNGGANVAIISLILAVALVLSIVLMAFKADVIGFIILTLATCAGGLAMYTDKKTVQPLTGFALIIALSLALIIIKFISLAKVHNLDCKFLARLTLTMVIDTILVNILLGTYWCSLMYGKGFMFYFTSRLIKNVIQLPINIMLTYSVLAVVPKHIREFSFKEKNKLSREASSARS